MTMNSEYGSYTKNYNLLKPDDKDFYDVKHINDNMDTVDEELYKLNQKTVLLDETVVDISGLIGKKTDTGGTTAEGTVMAKLNKILTDWTNARAGKIDTINNLIGATNNTGGTSSAGTVMGKLNTSLLNDVEIKNLIGQAGNTGGTASAGTTMAKLNKLLTDWTTARAGKIDTITSAIGQANNTGGTASAGTVMAKLNKLLSTISSGVGIKSVQRGTFEETPTDPGPSTAIKINISTINPSKTFIIINGGASAGYSGSSSAVRGYISAVTSNSFTYQTSRATLAIGNGLISYQVVEFY